MNHEIAVRVPEQIAHWVQVQPGSVSETVLELAGNAYKQGQYITLPDPGAGAGRVKLRLNPRVLRFIREATHSRDTTAAVRKLLAWGVRGTGLPSSPVRASLPEPRFHEPRPLPPIQPSTPVARKSPYTSLARVYEQNPELARLSTVRPAVEPELVTGDSLSLWPLTMPSPVRDDIPKVPPIIERGLTAIPDWALALGIAVGSFAAVYGIFRLIDWITLPAKTVSAMATVESAAPDIAAWIPKAAMGLGALL